jgi:tetratricopeptide (TPR) repeat protein
MRILIAVLVFVFTSHAFAQATSQLGQALKMVQNGQYQQAVPILYNMSRKPEFAKEKMQIKFILGGALLELRLNQIAAFQLVEVIKNGGSRYVKPAIEKLSMAADALGDDSLLNYAISKIRLEDVPENGKDLIYFRLGEVKLKNGNYGQALDLFGKVSQKSRYYFISRYNRGLALLEMKKPQEAIQLFKALIASRKNAGPTDTNRVAAQLGLARSYYQATDWENSIRAYREVPKDHFMWHDALFESSWALFRAAKFRSTLSNFQSLHSSYYQDYFIPESLLLRSIVYLYICKYDEMEKVLDLYEKTYGPVASKLNAFLNVNKDPLAYFSEVESSLRGKTKLPGLLSHHVLREGDVKRGFAYLRELNDEKNRLDLLPAVSKSAIGVLGKKIIANRYKNARLAIGELIRTHFIIMRSELRDFYEQTGFIRYEMINGKKEQLKKKIAGKNIPTQIEENVDRSMYVQNGYDYWPFNGEYWLDEIGNYHYLGRQSCE